MGPTLHYGRSEKVFAQQVNINDPEECRALASWCRGSVQEDAEGHTILVVPNSSGPHGRYTATHGEWVVERRPFDFVTFNNQAFQEYFCPDDAHVVADSVAELKALPLNTCGVDNGGHYWIKHAPNRWHCSCDGVSVPWSSKKMLKEIQTKADADYGSPGLLTLLCVPHDDGQ